MGVWTRVGAGTEFTGRLAHLFREETRTWFVRYERPLLANPITAKVYHAEADATAGNANFAASGSVTVGTDLSYTIPLTDNAAVAPVFTDATVGVKLLATGSISAGEVWKVDLGPRIERARLRVLRGFAVIKTANGYSHTLAGLEAGVRQWEDVDPNQMPYVGVSPFNLTAIPLDIGAGYRTTVQIQGVAHLVNSESTLVVSDVNVFHLYHDLRRALRAIERPATPYDGTVNNMPTFNSAELALSQTDRGLLWARERGTINFVVECGVDELDSEIAGA